MEALLLSKPWTEITASISYTDLHPHTHSPIPSHAFLSALTRPSPFVNPSTLAHPTPRSRRLYPRPLIVAERLWLKFVFDSSGYTLLITDWVRVWRRRASALDVLAEKEEYAAGVQLEGVVDTLSGWVEPLLTGRTRHTTQRLSHWAHSASFAAPSDDEAAPTLSPSPSPSLPPSPPPSSSLSLTLSSAGAHPHPPPSASFAHSLLLTSSLHLESLPVSWSFRCEPCGTAFDQAVVLRWLAHEPQLLTTKRLRDYWLPQARAGRQPVKEEGMDDRGSAPHANRRDRADGRRKRARGGGEGSQSASPPSQGMESEGPAEVSVPTLDELYEESMRQVSQSQSQSYSDLDTGAGDENVDEDAPLTAASQRAEPSQQGEPSQAATSSAIPDADVALDSAGLGDAGEYIETEAEKAIREAVLRCASQHPVSLPQALLPHSSRDRSLTALVLLVVWWCGVLCECRKLEAAKKTKKRKGFV